MKKLFGILLVLAAVLCLCSVALAAEAVSYVEYSWDGTSLSSATNTVTEYTPVAADTTAWNSGWYVASGDVTIAAPVTVTGSVNLLLTDGCSLTVEGDVSFGEGNSLTIYGQSAGTGKLKVTGSMAGGVNGNTGSDGAGDGEIGDSAAGNGSSGGNAGSVTVHGGSGGSVTVHGGSVNVEVNMACGGSGGNGGRGSQEKTCYGTGGRGGTGGSAGSVTVHGGTVTVTGSMAGGGSGGKGGSKRGNAGIGGNGGSGGTGSSVTVHGGTVTVAGSMAGGGTGGEKGGKTDGFGFGGNAGRSGTDGNVTGMIYQGNDGTVYGDVTLAQDLEIPAGTTLTVPEGASLTVNGNIINSGTLRLHTKDSLTVTGSLTGGGTNWLLRITAEQIMVPTDLVYNGTDQTETVKNGIRLEGSVTVFGANFTYDTTGWNFDSISPAAVKDAGDYTVSYKKEGSGSIVKSFSVQKRPFEIPADAVVSAMPETQRYWGAEYKPFSMVIGTGIGEDITVSGLTVAPQAANVIGPVTFDVNSANAVITIKDGSGKNVSLDNYDIKLPAAATGSIKVIPLTISGVKMAADSYAYGDTVSYDNTALSIAQPGGTVAKAEDLVYTYTGTANDSTAWNDTAAPTKAGTYTLTVSHRDTVHYEGKQEIFFTIDRAPVTVTALDKEMYIRQTTPDLSAPILDTDYAVEGLKYGEALGAAPALSYDGSLDTTKNGEYPINITGPAQDDNYQYTYVPGKLTVKVIGSIPNRAVKVKPAEGGSVTANTTVAKPGATIELTVTQQSGYQLKALKVTIDHGPEVVLTETNGKYTFKMPHSDVTVEAVFVSGGSETPVEKPTETTGCDKGASCIMSKFTDADKNAWYHDGVHYALEKGLMNWAVGQGIINGVTETTLQPQGNATRAQIATILMRYCEMGK